MKNARRLLTFLLALVMVMSLAVSVSAAKITIDDGAIEGAQYVAYRLLNAENVPNTDNATEREGTDFYIYTVNEKYRAVLKAALTLDEPASDKQIIDAIGKLGDNSEDLRNFADAVFTNIGTLSADATATDGVFSNVLQGYYLIAESNVGTIPNSPTDTFSLVMLDTAGLDEITVKTKEGLPTVSKLVEEIDDSTGMTNWQEYADYDIGDHVKFSITGTVSEKYVNYKSYDYMFVDTMESGLTMVSGSVVITIDGIAVTDEFTITYTTTGFTAVANLKELDKKLDTITIGKDTKIIATYTAELNSSATRGSDWNQNSVVLKYENNPYYVATPDGDTTPDPHVPGETPPDTAIVFTFEGNVDKVNHENKLLAGAVFALYKWYGTSETGDWKLVGNQITSDANGKLAWPGLDAGKYKLEEVDAPDGYNVANPIEFQVVATYSENALTKLTILDADGEEISSGDNAQFTVNTENGVFTTKVVNQTGTELPGTGGIGTTILYIAGGILVLGAVVLLVTKKRMASAD